MLVRDVKKVEDGVFEVTARIYGKDNVKFTCTDASIEEMFTGEYFIANIEGNYDDKTITSIEKTAAYEVSEKEGYVVKVTAEDGGFGIALGENMETEELQYVFVPEDTFNELGITVGTKVSVILKLLKSSNSLKLLQPQKQNRQKPLQKIQKLLLLKQQPLPQYSQKLSRPKQAIQKLPNRLTLLKWLT